MNGVPVIRSLPDPLQALFGQNESGIGIERLPDGEIILLGRDDPEPVRRRNRCLRLTRFDQSLNTFVQTEIILNVVDARAGGGKPLSVPARYGLIPPGSPLDDRHPIDRSSVYQIYKTFIRFHDIVKAAIAP